MATKAGMVTLADCVNGKTFWEVHLLIDGDGTFETTVRPVYCCGRGFKQSVRKVTEKYSRDMYLNKFMTCFQYDGHKKLGYYHSGVLFDLCYSKPLTDGNSQTIYRLFTTANYAKRFIDNLKLTFKPSADQCYAAIYNKRRQDDLYDDEINRLDNEINKEIQK